MLAIIREAFEQDEKDIPEGAEHVVTPKVPARNKLEGASKKRRKGAGRK